MLHGTHSFEFRLSGSMSATPERSRPRESTPICCATLTPADAPAFDRQKTPPEKREAYEAARFDGWAKRVSAVVTAILARSDNSGHVGVLGFSLGGYIAADTAVRDPRVAALALAVLYGGMPDAMVADVKHLPPLIDLHGNADHNVPFREGRGTG